MLKISDSRLAFIGGVHGVGKSTYCREVLEPLGFKVLTASTLISKHKSEIFDGSKMVTDIERNQHILIEAIRVESAIYSKLVIDGHYCLLNREQEIEPIPIWVFEQMKLESLSMLTADPQLIKKRLILRDKKNWSLRLIESFQEAELEHAQKASKALGLKLNLLE